MILLKNYLNLQAMDMQISFWKKILNPFIQIAGVPALIYGFAGVCITVVLSWITGLHFQGLLHMGWAPSNTFTTFLGEHLIIWLVPALLFYTSGLLLSRSRIRIVDVLGTTAFAQLPLIATALLCFCQPLRTLIHTPPQDITIEWLNRPEIMTGAFLALISTVFIVWTLIWMFKALKITCNMKGARLGIAYAVSIIGGDILAVYLISFLYKINV